MSLHDSILASVAGLEPEPVEVKEWGVTVYVRRFPLSEWLELTGGEEPSTWGILAAALVDEDGATILTPDEITNMPASEVGTLKRLATAVAKVNGGGVELGEE